MALNKLADYEDLEEAGLLARLLCKAGDTVYIILSPFGGIVEDRVNSIEIIFDEENGSEVVLNTERGSQIWKYDIGDTVCFTRPEAEKKLAELKGE